MTSHEAIRHATEMLNVLLTKNDTITIGIGFDKIAEIIRRYKIKVRIDEKHQRQFAIELFFLMERKNKATFANDFTEANRLRERIKILLVEKKGQEHEISKEGSGFFDYTKHQAIVGKLNKNKKTERLILQLFKAYNLLHQ